MEPRGEPTMDPAAMQRAFERDGWVHCPAMFEPDAMGALDQLIRNHYGDAPAREHTDEFIDGAGVDVVPWFPQREGETAFDAIEQSDQLTAATTALLGDGWRSDYVMAMYSTPESRGQAWHQDCPPESPQHFNLNRLIYTHDIADGDGGELVVVSGSHKRGALPPGDPHEELAEQIVVRPRAGDLVLVHGHTWHRVRAIGSRSRVSVNLRAVPATTPDGITDICVYRTMRYRFSTAEVLVRR